MALKFLLIFIISCEIIVSKKITSHKSSKPGDCGRCTVLTESFNYWLDKTARGKYEGGDTAWEEAKLKSYSRSEVRLVEIQESLCSELKTHQDSCYALAEEAEQKLELWWFHEDSHSTDMFTWLCIENLQQCCPKNHFGDTCSICPTDQNNKVCSGHGKCDGEGTRKGNGTCVCKNGYTGTLCENCDQNFYFSETGSCKSCHKSCSGCSGEGAKNCKACNAGWILEFGMCVDINECSTPVCKPNEYCTNTEGSFSCKECDLTCKSCLGAGPTNCTICEDTNVLWFGSCIDNELKQNMILTVFKRLAMYVGLLIITLFIYRTSKVISSLVLLIIAIYIYFSEKYMRIITVDVLSDLLLNLMH